MKPFAAGGAPDTYIERVKLDCTGCVDGALSRARHLQRRGFDVTALVDVKATHLVLLGCRYAEAGEQRASA